MLRRYQTAIIWVLGIVYFINFPGYASVVVDSGVPRVFNVYTFVVLLLPIAFRVASTPRLLNAVLTNPLLYWCLVYLLIACIWFPFSGHSSVEQQAFASRARMVLYVLGFLLLFSEPWSLDLARKAVVIACVIAAALNLVDFADPGLFVPLDEEFANPGRGAGFYINANRAGAALAIGFALGMGAVGNRWRVLFAAALLAGILVTFSRSAAIALFVVILIAWRGAVLSPKQVIVAVLGVTALAGIAVITLVSDSAWTDVANVDNMVARLSFFMDPLGTPDYSTVERSLAARTGLEYFADRPLLGHGIGATYAWRFNVSTHNMYLYYLVEYGVVGLLLFPMLIWVCVRGSRPPMRAWLLAWAAAMFTVGFFTHNAGEEPFFVLSYALAASMTSVSQRDFVPGAGAAQAKRDDAADG